MAGNHWTDYSLLYAMEGYNEQSDILSNTSQHMSCNWWDSLG